MSKRDFYTADCLGKSPTIRQQWKAFHRLWRMSHSNMWHVSAGLDWSVFLDFFGFEIVAWKNVMETGDSQGRIFQFVPEYGKMLIRTGDKEEGKRYVRNFLEAKIRQRKEDKRQAKLRLLEYLNSL